MCSQPLMEKATLVASYDVEPLLFTRTSTVSPELRLRETVPVTGEPGEIVWDQTETPFFRMAAATPLLFMSGTWNE